MLSNNPDSMNKILFLANTPMQLINASVLATTDYNNERCDVYFTNNIRYEAMSLVKDRVFESGYEISLVKDAFARTNVLLRTLVRVKNALDLRTIIKSLPSDAMQYKLVFLSGISLRNCEIYYAIKKINKGVQLNLFEEGIYEYVGFKYKNLLKILFSYLFFHQYYLKNCKKLYVYKPEFVQCSWDKIELKKINNHIENSLLQKLNKAFRYQKTILDGSSKYIILEQEFYEENENEIQKNLISELASIVGEKSVAIKLHPRSQLKKYGTEYDVVETTVPFEIIAMNENIAKNTFISVTSSAIINLYLMLDMEPNIIMLNKLFPEGNAINEDNDNLIAEIQHRFKRNNFWIPENNQEFKRLINHLIG